MIEKHPKTQSRPSDFEDSINLEEGRSIIFSDQRLVQKVPNESKNKVTSKIENRHIRQLFFPDAIDILSTFLIFILFIVFKSYIFDIRIHEYTFIGLYTYFAPNWSMTYFSFFFLCYWCWRWGYGSLMHGLSAMDKQVKRAYLDPTYVSVNLNFYGLFIFIILFSFNYLIGGLW